VCELATKLAATDPFSPKFLNATPLALMQQYSEAAGGFCPAPAAPKAHRLAGALAAQQRGASYVPRLGAVPTCAIEEVRDAEARAECGEPSSEPIDWGVAMDVGAEF
jgi:hypothetical protein